MSEKKTAVIDKSIFSNEWTNPTNKVIFYFDLILSNGDEGTLGVMEKDSPKVAVGTEIIYTIDNKKKIKLIEHKPAGGTTAPTRNFSNGDRRSAKVVAQEDFLGYAWSYAKDLIIAGKGSNDLEELNEVARYIYDEIGKMLIREY